MSYQLDIEKIVALCKKNNWIIIQDKDHDIFIIKASDKCPVCDADIQVNVVCNCPDGEH